ncbi:MAG TPA: peptidylprolyl isomerase [Thermoanaerobaculaceae bacterium]|nr:peptidylprolyl isomerase [Thermoanaerobaculaceae bacterium]HRS17120.1 peptidylprolyl isomerase [Thermoanaerobaculaceae bacterium]
MRGTFILSMLLVAAAGAAGDGEPDAARAALLAAADGRRFEAGQLATLARSADPWLRAETARVLGRLDRLETLDTLAALSRDPMPEVRVQAVEAIGRLALRWPGGLPQAEAKRAGAILAKAMKDPAAEVRAAACWAAPAVPFGKRGELLARRARTDPSLEVRVRALAELWRLSEQNWVATAAAAAREPDSRVRQAAAWSLARGGPGAGPVLAACAADRDPAVQVAALDGARRGHAAALWGPALAATGAGDAMVRAAAWTALAAALDAEPTRTLPQEIERRLAATIEQRDPERAQERVAAIRLAGAAKVCAARLEVVADGGENWVAAEAAAALGRWPERAEAVRRIATTDGDPRQLVVIRSLAKVAGGTTTLAVLLSHSEARVRLAAAEAAAASGAPELGPALDARLDDPDAAVRATAIEALSRAGRLPPTEELLGRLARERESKEADGALALIEALGAARELASEVKEALRQSAGVRDASVARAAWAVLVGHGEKLAPPVVATGEDSEHYRAVARWARTPRWLEVVTERGTLQIELDTLQAPLATHRLWRLVEDRFFDGLTFHRVVPTFVAQGGDPRGDGWGGPGFTLRHEDSLTPYGPGAVGLAHAGPDTAGCQLFVTLTRQFHLDGRYPVVGKVVHGLEVARRLRVGDRILRVRATEKPGHYHPVWYGAIDPARLDEGIEGWRDEASRYEPERRWLELLASARLRYELVVALGTWCGDSREQIPRLQAVLAALGERSPFAAVRLLGVDRSKWIDRELYPFGAVELVPTIVVTASGSEIGRIVETPASGRIEQDLARILAPLEGWELPEDPDE